MSFYHEVTDSRGQVHKRLSRGRQYGFAIVRHFPAWSSAVSGRSGPPYSSCGWSSTRQLAEAEARRYPRAVSVEIIPCTPIEKGKK